MKENFERFEHEIFRPHEVHYHPPHHHQDFSHLMNGDDDDDFWSDLIAGVLDFFHLLS